MYNKKNKQTKFNQLDNQNVNISEDIKRRALLALQIDHLQLKYVKPIPTVFTNEQGNGNSTKKTQDVQKLTNNLLIEMLTSALYGPRNSKPSSSLLIYNNFYSKVYELNQLNKLSRSNSFCPKSSNDKNDYLENTESNTIKDSCHVVTNLDLKRRLAITRETLRNQAVM